VSDTGDASFDRAVATAALWTRLQLLLPEGSGTQASAGAHVACALIKEFEQRGWAPSDEALLRL